MAGILNQLPVQQQAQPQITPEMVQAIIASQMQPVAMQGNFGANRFLTGNMALPMTFGVDVPAYETYSFKPGDFSKFKEQAQPTRQSSSFGDVVGYTQSGLPIYANPSDGGA
jgi:hypothetical protein